MNSIYDYSPLKPNGESQPLRDYQGKVILVVNTASKCGFTPQFKELQELYERYESQGFTVLGFPCDQFKDQEFGDITETLDFCQINYGVKFPMFAKIDVKGEQASPLFVHLKKEKTGFAGAEVKWNFTKFLIDREGNVVSRFAPLTKPSKLGKDIESLLAKETTNKRLR
ncbi:MAG: glutathione peroxidase [Gorillibacterium sp.]|nr:glutathione peroxidase [Gorillibacterium sp.]